MKPKHIILVGALLILFGVAARFLPHAPNMTPITAIAFVASMYLGRRWGLALPLIALFLSDIAIGFYDWKLMLAVYGSFAIIGLMSWVGRKYRSLLPVGLTLLGASLFFFLATNAAVWAFSPWYEKSIAGLLYSYELGLPFFKNMLAGDVVYTASLVAAFEAVRAGIVFFKNKAVLANNAQLKS